MSGRAESSTEGGIMLHEHLIKEALDFVDSWDESETGIPDPVPGMMLRLIEALKDASALLTADTADIETLARYRTCQEIAGRIADLRPGGFSVIFSPSARQRDSILWEAQRIAQAEANTLGDAVYRITHRENYERGT